MKNEAEYSAIKVDEPIEAYFNSARYAKTFKKIMVSSRETMKNLHVHFPDHYRQHSAWIHEFS